MSCYKWMALSLVFVILWVDVGALVLLFVNPVLGVVALSLLTPFSIGFIKKFISEWREL